MYLLSTKRERARPAKQKPSKKRKVLNMVTFTEKATLRPNTSMKSTERINTGCRPNLREKKTEAERERGSEAFRNSHKQRNYV